MTAVDHRPARRSAALALVAAAASVAALLAAFTAASIAGVAGLPLVAVGALGGRRRTLTLGAGLLVLGALGSAVLAAPPLPALVGVAGAVVAWDVGENGIGLGEQVGRAADSANAEYTHAAASALVGVVVVGLAYAVFLSFGGGRPLAALVLLLVAAVLLTAGLRE